MRRVWPLFFALEKTRQVFTGPPTDRDAIFSLFHSASPTVNPTRCDRTAEAADVLEYTRAGFLGHTECCIEMVQPLDPGFIVIAAKFNRIIGFDLD